MRSPRRPTLDAGAATTTPPATTAPATTAEPPTTSAASDTATGTDGAATSRSGAAATLPSSELEIRIWPEGRDAGAPTVYTLTCLPDGGTLPSPAEACQTLAQMP